MIVIENWMKHGLDVKMQMYFLTFSSLCLWKGKEWIVLFQTDDDVFHWEKKTLKRLLIFTHKIVHRRYKNGRNKQFV